MGGLRELTLDGVIATGLEAPDAVAVLAGISRELQAGPDEDPCQVWRRLSKFVLLPDHPWALHKLLYEAAYAGGGWDAATRGPPPAWVPAPEGVAATNIASFMREFQGNSEWRAQRSGDVGRDWALLQRLSFADPEAFWPPVLRRLRVRFHSPPARVLQPHPDPDQCRWLPGARLNIAECALAGRDPDRPAVVWADEAEPTVLRTWTLGQLARAAAHVADALRASGLQPGAAVAIDMPLGPEAAAAYLGTVLAGCVVVSIADSFPPAEIRSRLRIARAAAVVTQDVILRGGKTLPLYARVVEAGAPPAIVLPARGAALEPEVPLRPGDVSWSGFLARAPQPAGLRAHVADAYAPTNVLFSSGTTGEPKAIAWSHVTPLRCGADAFFHQDVRPGDVVCWPTSLGWMMGPWLLYASLLNGACAALFQGSPLGRPFGEFVQAAGVACLGLVPSIAKAWRASGCMRGLRWPRLRCFSSTGEASAPDDALWLMARGGYVPVIEYCGGTELGGAFLTATMVQPAVPSAFSTPSVGACPVIMLPDSQLSPHGDPAAACGEVALGVPMLGASQSLLNRDHREAYYRGMPPLPGSSTPLRRHGDEVERLPGAQHASSSWAAPGLPGGNRPSQPEPPTVPGAGSTWPAASAAPGAPSSSGSSYYRARGRVDDTMNLGGIKVASVELERAVAEGVPGVLEAAAVACPAPGGGPDQLVLFVVPRPGARPLPAGPGLLAACQAAVSARLNPLFRVARALPRAALPRNASNKVVRRELRAELLAARPKL